MSVPSTGTLTYAPQSCYITPQLYCIQALIMTNSISTQFIAMLNNNMGTSIKFASANSFIVVPFYYSSASYGGTCTPQDAGPGALITCTATVPSSLTIGTQLNPRFSLSYQICSPSCGGQVYNTSGQAISTAVPYRELLFVVHLATSTGTGQIAIDGADYAPGANVVWVYGIKHTVYAVQPNGYSFGSWAHGSNLTLSSSSQSTTVYGTGTDSLSASFVQVQFSSSTLSSTTTYQSSSSTTTYQSTTTYVSSSSSTLSSTTTIAPCTNSTTVIDYWSITAPDSATVYYTAYGGGGGGGGGAGSGSNGQESTGSFSITAGQTLTVYVGGGGGSSSGVGGGGGSGYYGGGGGGAGGSSPAGGGGGGGSSAILVAGSVTVCADGGLGGNSGNGGPGGGGTCTVGGSGGSAGCSSSCGLSSASGGNAGSQYAGGSGGSAVGSKGQQYDGGGGGSQGNGGSASGGGGGYGGGGGGGGGSAGVGGSNGAAGGPGTDGSGGAGASNGAGAGIWSGGAGGSVYLSWSYGQLGQTCPI